MSCIPQGQDLTGGRRGRPQPPPASSAEALPTGSTPNPIAQPNRFSEASESFIFYVQRCADVLFLQFVARMQPFWRITGMTYDACLPANGSSHLCVARFSSSIADAPGSQATCGCRGLA
ncbi:MAG: hypothetical protein CMB79_03750 [Filomicrobium sp.]|nr:hypothetical protein [Filomicrobium sp.]